MNRINETNSDWEQMHFLPYGTHEVNCVLIVVEFTKSNYLNLHHKA